MKEKIFNLPVLQRETYALARNTLEDKSVDCVAYNDVKALIFALENKDIMLATTIDDASDQKTERTKNIMRIWIFIIARYKL